LAFLTQNKAKLWKQIDHNIGFIEKRHFFRRKLTKITENCDYNIDPWSSEFEPFLFYSSKFSAWLKVSISCQAQNFFGDIFLHICIYLDPLLHSSTLLTDFLRYSSYHWNESALVLKKIVLKVKSGSSPEKKLWPVLFDNGEHIFCSNREKDTVRKETLVEGLWIGKGFQVFLVEIQGEQIGWFFAYWAIVNLK
jgi:hypothetical protein